MTASSLPKQASRPFRRLVLALTAGAMAMSLMAATALPARADDSGDRIAKAIVAAIAIGAIANAIEKDKRRTPRVDPVPVHRPRVSVLPDTCAIEVMGQRRNVTVYPERCLRREGVSGRLPAHCAREARIYGRTDRIYSETCLLDAGFRVRSRGHDRGWSPQDDRWGYDRRY